MTPETVVDLFRHAFVVAFSLAAPLLLVGFAVGLAINLVQVATSLQDASISAVPRLGAFLGGFLVMLPWMLKQMSVYAIDIFGNLGRYAK
jgi:flagellar biosynthesis protein FliQ